MFRVKDNETFIQRSREVHGDYYDYSCLQYVNSNTKVILICPVHGKFFSIPRSHIYNGAGCHQCHRRKLGLPRKEIISRNTNVIKSGKRQCSWCREFYDLSQFSPSKVTKDGLSSICKECQVKFTAEYRETIPPKTKKEKQEINKRSWIRHKELHKEELEQKRLKRESFLKERRVIAKIARRLRSRIRSAINKGGGRKRYHQSEYLGCSYEYFIFYIESQFKEGMSWDNYGYYGWHLDHIIPCASFDLTKTEEQKKCFHYTNYQPLWSKLNLQKSSWYNGRRYKKVN